MSTETTIPDLSADRLVDDIPIKLYRYPNPSLAVDELAAWQVSRPAFADTPNYLGTIHYTNRNTWTVEGSPRRPIAGEFDDVDAALMAYFPGLAERAEKRQEARRLYAERFNEAARTACTTYLNGLGMYGDVRRHQEYDNLDEAGKAVWRAVALRASQAMPAEPER
jgi:hypothetical protein